MNDRPGKFFFKRLEMRYPYYCTFSPRSEDRIKIKKEKEKEKGGLKKKKLISCLVKFESQTDESFSILIT